MQCNAFKTKSEGIKLAKVISAGGMSLLLLMGQTVPLLGNPTGGAVVAGAATIGPAGATLSIHQSTQNAIINWQQFSIAGGETTKFIVPTSGATLNRVTGGNISAIYGNLQSNGALYLVNPSGIVVGPSGRINTASFLASTLDVSNQQFLAGGNLEFAGTSNASVENDGVIHASTGDVYLIANQVTNKGTLSAAQGTVGLAAGSDVLFQQAGSQHLFVQATPAGTKRAVGVTNAGTIRAAAAELKAAGGNAYALAINNTGVIAATGYKKINGQVYLTSDGGSIGNSGKITAKQANGNGGTILIDGTATASTTSGTVTNSGTLDASATVAGGQGGTVSLKNMGGTTVNTASGQILATGGTNGTGGNIETSGGWLKIAGIVSAGKGGLWLLDPADVTIDNGTGVAPDVKASTLIGGLNAGMNEVVQTVGGTTDSGNIDLNVPLSWTSSATLQLTASGNINLNQALTATTGTLTMSAGGTISDTAALSVGAFILTGGSWSQVASTLPSFTATNFELQGGTFARATSGNGTSGTPYVLVDIYGLQGLVTLPGDSADLGNNISASSTASWNAGAGFVPIGNSEVEYSGTFNGQGNTIDSLHINTAVATDIGLFGDTSAGSMVENVGITNANVVSTTSDNLGTGALVGSSSGTVNLCYSTGMVVGNGQNVGGLVGYNDGTLSNSYSNVNASATMGNYTDVGGLLGFNDTSGMVLHNYTTGGSVTGGYDMGGLVADNRNIINGGYSTESITTGTDLEVNNAGGLTGYAYGGSISNVYSTGSVSGGGSGSYVGGLIGDDGSTLSNAYSTGSVTAQSGASYVGGSVGYGFVTFTNVFWDTTTAGQSAGSGSGAVAGITGATTTDLTSQSFISMNSTLPGYAFGTVWTTNGNTTTPQLIGLPATGLPTGGGNSNSSNTTSTSSSSGTGGIDMSGSNTVPPVLTPQIPPVTPPGDPVITTSQEPPFSFTGSGISNVLGQEEGGLADSSGNSGQVTSGDTAQMSGGQLNNANNPQAASALNVALGPIVYSNLADALKDLGDWADVPDSAGGNTTGDAGGDETILTAGGVAEMSSSGVKSIPLSQAPEQLQNAMNAGGLQGH